MHAHAAGADLSQHGEAADAGGLDGGAEQARLEVRARELVGEARRAGHELGAIAHDVGVLGGHRPRM